VSRALAALLVLSVAAAARAGPIQDDVIAAAETYLGKPYVFGGRDGRPGCRGVARCASGIDCQSLIFFAYEKALGKRWSAFSVMPSISARRGELGWPVPGLDGVLAADADTSRLQKGDVLFFLLDDYNLDADPPLLVHDGRRYGTWHTALVHGVTGGVQVIHAKPGERVVIEPLAAIVYDALYVLRLPYERFAPRLTPVHVESSVHGRVFVVDDGDLRHLRFGAADGQDQSIVSLRHPETVPLEYVRESFSALAFVSKLERVLMIGVGGGAFTTRLVQSAPAVEIDAVDIDPAVIGVATRFFGVRASARLRIHEGDGRAFLEAAQPGYDLVYVDAYGDDGIPAHLTDRAFFATVAARLAPGGAALFNLALDDRAAERELASRIRAELPGVACMRTPEDGNMLIVATRAAPSRGASLARARELAPRLGLPWDLARSVARLEVPCASLFAGAL
jgi:spermidine synthase